jgi:hypothetical protein
VPYGAICSKNRLGSGSNPAGFRADSVLRIATRLGSESRNEPSPAFAIRESESIFRRQKNRPLLAFISSFRFPDAYRASWNIKPIESIGLYVVLCYRFGLFYPICGGYLRHNVFRYITRQRKHGGFCNVPYILLTVSAFREC